VIAPVALGCGEPRGAKYRYGILGRRKQPPRTCRCFPAAFLLGVPNAAGQLEEGLAIFEFSCEDVEEGRL